MRELKNALHSERSKTGRLMRAIEQKVLEQKSSEATDMAHVTSSTAGKSKSSTEKGRTRGEGTNPATLQEHESIIKRLQGKLDQKTHEVCSTTIRAPNKIPPPAFTPTVPKLTQIKADLRDVLYSHKWTPDAYLMARAYISDESEADTKRHASACLFVFAFTSHLNIPPPPLCLEQERRPSFQTYPIQLHLRRKCRLIE